ncbi:MAG: hypothetical protein CMK61_01935 [Pseudoalteromonadaceae bacterium]|nr:hypothetical protein [Pseudoalteromonadaceae bacterium]
MKLGGRWLIAESDIKEFIKQHTSSTV